MSLLHIFFAVKLLYTTIDIIKDEILYKYLHLLVANLFPLCLVFLHFYFFFQ